MMANRTFENQIFDYSDFSGKCLVGVKFLNCSVRFCNFSNSDLSYSLFESCDLYQSKFNEAVLYFTRISNCDATKAVFTDSFLNGIRIQNTVVTYTEFGQDFKTGHERKSTISSNVTDEYLKLNTGDTLPDITNLEATFKGIYVIDNNIAIQFINADKDKWRILKRKSEISLSIKKILEENGYKDKSLHYYFLHRQYFRKSKRNSIIRFFDYVGNELFWGYGVRLLNPVLSFFINCIFFSIIYSILPVLNEESGMAISGDVIHVISNPLGINFIEYFKILYGSFLISSLSVIGDIDFVGYAKIFVVLHTMISVLLIGLGITALSKKLANS